ncbi:MAG TPA: PAS domain S-box protein [Syntrophorhabdales bacterium]|nr:PAS domain S-box protein [Syntrophorhabdales bacterium]
MRKLSLQRAFPQSIRGRLILLMLAVLVPILILQAYTYYDVYRDRRNQELLANLEMGRAMGKTFEGFINDLLRQELAIGLAATASPSISASDFRRLLEKSAKDNPAVRRFNWVDPNGIVTASSMPSAVGISIADRDYFQQVRSGREWSVSELLLSKVEQLPSFGVCRAIRDAKGTFLGVVMAAVDPERMDDALAVQRAEQGATSLIDDKGMLVYRYPHVTWTWEQRRWLEMLPMLKRSLAGEELSFVDLSPISKTSRIMAAVPIRSIGWVAAAGRNEEDAMRPVVSFMRRQGIAFASVCFLALLAALGIARTIALPIEKLQAHTRLLKDGDLGARIAEDGPSELKGLSQTFNTMAGQLQADITRREESEQTLRESEQRYRSLVSLSPDCIAVHRNGCMRYVNPAGTRLLGASSPHELIGKSIYEYIPPERLETSRARVRQVQEEGLSTPLLEGKYLRPDGTAFWGEATGTPITYDGEPSVQLIIRDVTQRRKAEEQLQESHRLFLDVIDGSPSPIFLKDREGRFITINASLEKMLGITREKLKGKTDFDIATKDVADYWRSHDAEVMRTGQPLQIEETADLQDGHHVFLTCKFPLVNTSGEVYGVGAISHDITDRKRTEEALKESEQRFRTLTEAALEGIGVSENGRLVDANDQLLKILGGTRAELIGKEIATLVAPEDRDRVMSHIRSGVESHLEHRMFRLDGTPISVETHGRTIGNQGRQMRITAIRDITERKQAEKELQKLASVVRFSGELVNVSTLDGKMVFLNEAGARMLGVEPEEVERTDILQVIPDHLQEKARAEVLPALREHGAWEGDLQYRNLKTGALTDVHAMCFTIADPQTAEPLFLANVSLDITQRKRVEKALHESEEKFRLIATNTPDHILMQDAQLRYTWVLNPQLGLTEEDMLGKTDFDILSEHDAKTLTIIKRRVLETGTTEYVSSPLKAPDGAVHYFEGSYIPKRDARGRTNGIIGYFRNVTARVKMEEALRKAHDELERRVEERTAELTQAYKRLETEMTERAKVEEQLWQAQKMEAIGTLAGGIAHDFNNVLAAIIGFTELAKDNIPADADAQHHLNRIFQSGLRGRDLVKQILAFSRKAKGERKELSFTPLINETHALLRSSLPSTIQMPLLISTNDDHVFADATQLQQVLMNLATNAADAMREEGGQLTIALSSVVFPEGSVLPDPDMSPGTYLKLTVKDTGMGMTEDVRQRIFEPFFTTKELGKGTGMGLAVVYGVIKSHNGAVTVQSEVGQGSTFDVFLPHVQKPEATREETRAFALPRGTERILFVDDEELLMEMGQSMLEHLGYQVTVAANGAEAWNLFLEDPSRFDLVITDQTMPDVTGLTLARKMLRVRKELPIILCTGYSEMVSPEKAKDVGICAFVMKPVVRKDLAETVRRVLDGATVGI